MPVLMHQARAPFNVNYFPVGVLFLVLGLEILVCCDRRIVDANYIEKRRSFYVVLSVLYVIISCLIHAFRFQTDIISRCL